MNSITNDIRSVVELMRPVSLSTYGQPMLDYLTAQGQIGDVSLMPYYLFGHRLDIANRLTAMDKDSTKAYKKYPLIVLMLDTVESYGDGVVEYSLNIGIMTHTNKNYTSEQRIENVFNPVLYPLYEVFIEKLRKSRLFMWNGDQSFPPHKKIDRLFWGTAGGAGNTAHIFKDPLDAIELVELKCKSLIKC